MTVCLRYQGTERNRCKCTYVTFICTIYITTDFFHTTNFQEMAFLIGLTTN